MPLTSNRLQVTGSRPHEPSVGLAELLLGHGNTEPPFGKGDCRLNFIEGTLRGNAVDVPKGKYTVERDTAPEEVSVTRRVPLTKQEVVLSLDREEERVDTFFGGFAVDFYHGFFSLFDVCGCGLVAVLKGQVEVAPTIRAGADFDVICKGEEGKKAVRVGEDKQVGDDRHRDA